jgi:GDP-mannose 6-dehydrogenase
MTTAISIFGLGYVGCVSAACFASDGFRVVGVDVARSKVDQINAGRSTIVEEGIAQLVADVVAQKRLSATTDVKRAVLDTDLSLVCVGTPSRPNGSIDLQYVVRVSEEIGAVLREKGRWHTVVIRSTVMPGTIDTHVIPAIERASGLKHGVGFAVCSNPEFLREGTSIKDFRDPPFTLIGAVEPSHAEPVAALYGKVSAQTHVVALRVAEMIKYACNCFHGLKVGFANEIGNVCKAMGVDSHEVMRLFCEDRKLNISPAYLKPGFAFGGSCLPKDLRAVIHRGRLEDVPLPILEATLDSNRRQIDRAFHMIAATGSRRIGILGLAFKSGTDDLRESPMVTLVEMLVGKGFELLVHDKEVSEANVIGANRDYVEREIPHLWKLMRPDVRTVLEQSDVVVLGNGSPEYRALGSALDGRLIVDLARALPGRMSGDGYKGICW